MKELLNKTLLNRRTFIFSYVLGFILKGFVIHFIPVFGEFYRWMIIVWALLLIGFDLIQKHIQWDIFQKLLWGFLGIALLASALGPDGITFAVLESLLEYLIHAYLFFTAYRLYDRDSFQNFLDHMMLWAGRIILAIAACSLLFLLLYRMNVSLPFGLNSYDRLFTYGHKGEADRFCGLFGYSTYGGSLCMAAILMALHLENRNRIPRVVSVVAASILIVTIYCLDVRADLLVIAFIMMVIYYHFLTRKISEKKGTIVFAVSIVIAVIALLFLKQASIHSFIEKFQQDPKETMIVLSSGRYSFWSLILEHIPERPVLGWGWLCSDIIGYFDSHNVFMNVLMWTGAVGLFVFIVFLIVLFQRILLNKTAIHQLNDDWLLILMFCVLLESMFERNIVGTFYNTGTSLFWLIGGFLSSNVFNKTNSES